MPLRLKVSSWEITPSAQNCGQKIFEKFWFCPTELKNHLHGRTNLASKIFNDLALQVDEQITAELRKEIEPAANKGEESHYDAVLRKLPVRSCRKRSARWEQLVVKFMETHRLVTLLMVILI